MSLNSRSRSTESSDRAGFTGAAGSAGSADSRNGQIGPDRERLAGTFYTIGAFVLWGLLPLFWDQLRHVGTVEVLAHRVIWSFLIVGAVVLIGRRRQLMEIVRERRRRRAVLLLSLLIGGNWFFFIYAVNIEQVIQASLGYYINPLFSILLGTVVLRERLGAVQFVAVLLAAAGVTILTVRFGAVPWIALGLTFTFGCYGLVKKIARLDSLTSLALETTILAPLALVLLGVWTGDGGAFVHGSGVTRLLLILSGVATALPLYWFAQGAHRVPLSQIGFTQYIGPSLMLLIGVFVFSEPFTTTHAVSFGIIWTALALYSLSHTPLLRRLDRRTVSFAVSRFRRRRRASGAGGSAPR